MPRFVRDNAISKRLVFSMPKIVTFKWEIMCWPRISVQVNHGLMLFTVKTVPISIIVEPTDGSIANYFKLMIRSCQSENVCRL